MISCLTWLDVLGVWFGLVAFCSVLFVGFLVGVFWGVFVCVFWLIFFSLSKKQII